jgi:uncharacterized protein YdeI (YjbR/CyaY-like superfamily)
MSKSRPKIKIPRVVSFRSGKEWHRWLSAHHVKTAEGVWLRIFKKDSGQATVTYDEALDEALCFGWIDGQKRAHDAVSWIQRFTPRRKRSMWSKRNIAHVARLIKAGRMRTSGLKEVEAAKTDGRWARAYDSAKDAVVPADFLQALAKNKKAEQFFKTLNRANTYAIAWRLQTALKPETRARRIKALLDLMARGEKLH